MIPYADLLGRSYRRDGLDPAGPLSCLGVVLVLLDRHGIPGAPRIDAAPAQAEATLAAWASADESPWATLRPGEAGLPAVGDVWLLDSDGDPAGLAIVVCARQGLAVTSVPERGVVALKVRALRPKLLQVYRWRGAA